MRITLPSLPPAATRCAFSALLATPLTTMPAMIEPAFAVSGGGKDFSGMSIEGEDFSGQQLKGKEFRDVRAANSKFNGAGLQSTSFFQADLSNAEFKGADLTGASLEQAGFEGVVLDNAVMVSSYFTRTISDAKSITGADFSESVMPEKTQKALCAREDAKGVNPTTKVETRESLMCPD